MSEPCERMTVNWTDYLLRLGLTPDKAREAEQAILRLCAEEVLLYRSRAENAERHNEVQDEVVERLLRLLTEYGKQQARLDALEAANATQAARIADLEVKPLKKLMDRDIRRLRAIDENRCDYKFARAIEQYLNGERNFVGGKQ